MQAFAHAGVLTGSLGTHTAWPWIYFIPHVSTCLKLSFKRTFCKKIIEICVQNYLLSALLRLSISCFLKELYHKDIRQVTSAANHIMFPYSNVHFKLNNQVYHSARGIDFAQGRPSSHALLPSVPNTGKYAANGMIYRPFPLIIRHPLQMNYYPHTVHQGQGTSFEDFSSDSIIYQHFPVDQSYVHRPLSTETQDKKAYTTGQQLSSKMMEKCNGNLVNQRTVKRKGSCLGDAEIPSYSKKGRHGSLTENEREAKASSSSQPAALNSKVIFYEPGDGYDNITEDIVHHYNQHHQSQQDLEHKIMLSNCLYEIVKDVFPGCKLFIVGSSLNGFGTRASDMDLCLLLSQGKAIDQRFEAVHILSSIHNALRCCSFVKYSQVIKAKVPILKFTDIKKNIECDLNINNGVGIRNTHLLKYYCMADPRVGPLMLYIKYWARFHDINDARKRTISSYSLALMLIHYLQAGCDPPVLPSLQKLYPAQFNAQVCLRKLRLDEPLHNFQTFNRDSLGKLFCGFLEYFAFHFKPDQEVISVREGGVLSIHRVRRNSDEPSQWKRLCIEEPFDRSNTARSVFDAFIFQRVMHVFKRSAQTLKETRKAKSILSQPF